MGQYREARGQLRRGLRAMLRLMFIQTKQKTVKCNIASRSGIVSVLRSKSHSVPSTHPAAAWGGQMGQYREARGASSDQCSSCGMCSEQGIRWCKSEHRGCLANVP